MHMYTRVEHVTHVLLHKQATDGGVKQGVQVVQQSGFAGT